MSKFMESKKLTYVLFFGLLLFIFVASYGTGYNTAKADAMLYYRKACASWNTSEIMKVSPIGAQIGQNVTEVYEWIVNGT